jgi:hypothetical protein
MDQRISRFKLCDLRFHPYLKRVIGRLPEKVREIVLNDQAFQILTDDEIFETLVLRYEFGSSVRNLVYLNTKILLEPDHQIIHTIASEMAHYILKVEGTLSLERKVDDLLIEWGFKKEIEAVRYDMAIAESNGYKIGYDWAKKQSHDYLMQHFGLYFDQWNNKGLGSLTSQEFNMLSQNGQTDSIFEKIIRLNTEDAIAASNDKAIEAFSLRDTLLAGIMAATKEVWT